MQIHDFDLVSIAQAARFYGVSVVTLRRWEREGRLIPHSRTLGNHRRYRLRCNEKLKIGYARVSSHDQKSDLVTQVTFLKPHCDRVLEDLGSGLNCKKPRLRQLISLLLSQSVSELHLTHSDRLLRFGHELVYQLCKWSGCKVVIHNESEVISFEHELCKDVITLMTVFSARLYGKRSHKNKVQIAA